MEVVKEGNETPVNEEAVENKETLENEKAVADEAAAKANKKGEIVTLSAEEFEKVRKHIETLQTEKDETVALAQRLQADFDNYRKRNAKLHLESIEEGERNVIKALLPVLDNFDRALESVEGQDEAWISGVKLVQRQLLDALHKYGLEEIPAEGMFDPALHEAVMQQEREGAESGSILMVVQKGYKVHDRIVRHSMVSVAK